MDPEQRDPILALAASHGIADRLRVTELGAAPLSDAELNLVYNACEVGVNSAMGEGWGMVSFEHAATGAAQIVPDSSACAELWEGAAELVAARDTGVPGFSMLAMSTVTAEGIAGALERLYWDPVRRRALPARRTATRRRSATAGAPSASGGAGCSRNSCPEHPIAGRGSRCAFGRGVGGESPARRRSTER